jgi:hypothetical protein
MQSSCSQTKPHSPPGSKQKLPLDCLANVGLLLSFGAYFALAYYTLVIVDTINPNEQFAVSPANTTIDKRATDGAGVPLPENKYVQYPAAIPPHP